MKVRTSRASAQPPLLGGVLGLDKCMSSDCDVYEVEFEDSLLVPNLAVAQPGNDVSMLKASDQWSKEGLDPKIS